MFANEIARTIAEFLGSIGVGVRACPLPESTFLPGVEVRGGELLVDESRLTYPGDLLHEAGHLAVMTAEERAGATDVVEHEDPHAWEAAVVAWSYAAALHLGIDPAAVIHSGGYRGRSEAILRTYGYGVFPGAGTLAALGMTRGGTDPSGPPFPAMVRWLRE